MEETKKNELKDEQLKDAAGGHLYYKTGVFTYLCNNCGNTFVAESSLKCPNCDSMDTKRQ